MIRRSFVFVLFILIGAGVNLSQTPAPKPEKETAPKVFSFSFDGDGGYLGVQAEEVSKDNFAKFGLREVKGVGIESVVDGSPAQAAGLQKGDVILKLNGEAVTSTRKLSRLVSEIAPDHQARLTISSGGSEREVTVTVGKRPGVRVAEGSFTWSGPLERLEMPDMPNLKNLPRIEMVPELPEMSDGPIVWALGNRRQIGVGVMPLGKQLADHFGVAGGVLVSSVREDSAAAKAGIKAGDIITEVDGKAITGDLELTRAIGAKKDGSVALTIVRDRNRQTINVTPEEVKGQFEKFMEFSTPQVPGTPDAPSVLRMVRPAVPPAPRPLNRIVIPRRIV